MGLSIELNKRVNLLVKYDKEPLFFTGVIIAATETHITFLDRYNDKYVFKLQYIEEISPAT